ncbi:hypothetical protein NQU59_01755 [Acinetobacter colistiniresistens]|uniref:hypothetical protein n=1 Tax=Acinetobacter colistiniresistens TaxID=280145 RepID=UPI00211C1FF7|nr:hypothetical protein [Acinetobacter colistiniresistens]UUM27903.1 hypothetical protein NQU59_01755 [Acinetobacter colistiniresistens]
MSSVLYLSDQVLHHLHGQKAQTIDCHAVSQYKKNLQEIKQRKQWKTSGTGAQFMGVANYNEQDELGHVYPVDAVLMDDQHVIYAAQLQDGCAIYIKSLLEPQQPEALVLRNNEFIIHHMDYDAQHKRLILSASQGYAFEQHLCVLGLDSNRIQYITEGDCQDQHPCFDPQNPDIIYYDSCGFAYDQQGGMSIGPKEICRLNLKTGDLETIIADPRYDYYKPQIDAAGQLYFLKRPYKNQNYSGNSLKDIVLAPFKIIRAVFGWLDFFTQRYTGESLKSTSGSNPAKSKQKSEEELFVEGNLIKAQKALQQNQSAGEKFVGVIPRSWELIQCSSTGEQKVLKRGVLGYRLNTQGLILYSNGKHLVSIAADQTEQMLVEAKLIQKIMC